MTVLVLGCAMVTALCIGYHLGRRTGTRPSTWQQRTSWLAIGRLAAGLIGRVLARRIQRSLFAHRALAASVWGRPTGGLQVLRATLRRL